MSAHDRTFVCPWWFCFVFDNRLRHLYQKPEDVLGPYVRAGMSVLDLGCGMGYFTIPMAEMVGLEGRVIAVDLQPQMLRRLAARAEKRGVGERITSVRCVRDDIRVSDPVDFALAMWVVHEVPDKGRFVSQIRDVLKPGGTLLLAEPRIHVTRAQFERIVLTAETCGMKRLDDLRIGFSRAVLMTPEAG